MKIRVAITDDNYLLSKSIKEKLELFAEEIEYKFTASNGKEMLLMLEQDHSVDAILMDIEMPEMDGIEATKNIIEKYPQIKIIMLTVFDDDQKIFSAIQAGAMGYLLKDETPDVLLTSLKMVMTGGAPMSPSIALKTLKLLKNPERIENTGTTDYGLSNREIEILEQTSQGLDYKEISKNLYIAPSTVRKHIENIYKKLQVNNKMKAVKVAMQNKII
ncbi:MAG: response regulator transcription factor [Ignavibacteriae bacterium]|nr:DNA-binding response regulator [Ignavibacteriota bacterium]NOG98554.1 response regulator transcription factor [Ignavibacteriota bacterium]